MIITQINKWMVVWEWIGSVKSMGGMDGLIHGLLLAASS